MEVLLIVAIIGVLGLALANLGCTIYVVIKLYQESGLMHAPFGFFCCSIYPFIWGWINASRLKMYDVMIFWTATSILLLLLQLTVQLLDPSGEHLFEMRR